MDYASIGKHIRECRVRKGLRQEETAELVGLSTNYYGSIERGEKIPALEVSADELLQDTVDHAMESNSSEIATLIQSLPRQDQQKLLSAIRAYVDACRMANV